MTTTPEHPTTARPGRPPIVDRATWQTARNELLVRENAYELFRRADGPIDDDIPADAPTVTFD